MMTVRGQHYIFKETNWLRLDLDQHSAEKVEDLRSSYWWSSGPVQYYNGKAYFVTTTGDFGRPIWELTFNPPTLDGFLDI